MDHEQILSILCFFIFFCSILSPFVAFFSICMIQFYAFARITFWLCGCMNFLEKIDGYFCGAPSHCVTFRMECSWTGMWSRLSWHRARSTRPFLQRLHVCACVWALIRIITSFEMKHIQEMHWFFTTCDFCSCFYGVTPANIYLNIVCVCLFVCFVNGYLMAWNGQSMSDWECLVLLHRFSICIDV